MVQVQNLICGFRLSWTTCSPGLALRRKEATRGCASRHPQTTIFPSSREKIGFEFCLFGSTYYSILSSPSAIKKPELSLCCEVAFNTPRMFLFVLVIPQHLLEGIFYTAHMSRLFLSNEIFVWSGHLACWDDG